VSSTLTPAHALAVALGGVVGCLLRWLAGVWLNTRWEAFPLGTLFVNCAALFWFERTPDETLRLLVVTGVLGGFTTFSSFSVESLVMLQRGQYALAAAHALAHVLGALVCAGIGFRLAKELLMA